MADPNRFPPRRNIRIEKDEDEDSGVDQDYEEKTENEDKGGNNDDSNVIDVTEDGVKQRLEQLRLQLPILRGTRNGMLLPFSQAISRTPPSVMVPPSFFDRYYDEDSIDNGTFNPEMFYQETVLSEIIPLMEQLIKDFGRPLPPIEEEDRNGRGENFLMSFYIDIVLPLIKKQQQSLDLEEKTGKRKDSIIIPFNDPKAKTESLYARVIPRWNLNAALSNLKFSGSMNYILQVMQENDYKIDTNVVMWVKNFDPKKLSRNKQVCKIPDSLGNTSEEYPFYYEGRGWTWLNIKKDSIPIEKYTIKEFTQKFTKLILENFFSEFGTFYIQNAQRYPQEALQRRVGNRFRLLDYWYTNIARVHEWRFIEFKREFLAERQRFNDLGVVTISESFFTLVFDYIRSLKDYVLNLLLTEMSERMGGMVDNNLIYKKNTTRNTTLGTNVEDNNNNISAVFADVNEQRRVYHTISNLIGDVF
jgi:hypothetical protein